MSLRTIAVLAAAVFALLVLLWTCTPESAITARDAPKNATNERSAVPSQPAQRVTAEPRVATAAISAVATRQADAAACRGVALAQRCDDQLRRARFARGSKALSQPVVEEACNAPGANRVPWRALFEAATHGHVPSMVRFGNSSLFRHDAEWDLEAVALYRVHGYDFLRRAAEAGDGGAVFALAKEMLTPGFGEGAIPLDRVKGLAYARLLLRHADENWRSKLTSQTIGSAFRFTAQEFAEAEILSHQLMPAAAEARLDGWNPNLDDAENDYGCAG